MPHICIECSAHLGEMIDLQRFVRDLHKAAISTGVFASGAVRTFAVPCSPWVTGDGSGQGVFVRIHARIAPGRSAEVKQTIRTTLFDTANVALESVFALGPAALQVEVTEFERDFSASRNTMLATTT